MPKDGHRLVNGDTPSEQGLLCLGVKSSGGSFQFGC